jgi:hypothetical protein
VSLGVAAQPVELVDQYPAHFAGLGVGEQAEQLDAPAGRAAGLRAVDVVLALAPGGALALLNLDLD